MDTKDTAANNSAPDLRASAEAVVRDALDRAQQHVHPCDVDNDRIKSRHLPPLMLALYHALQQPAASGAVQDKLREAMQEVADLTRGHLDARHRISVIAERALAAAKASPAVGQALQSKPDCTVPMPQNEMQAELMAKLGVEWLRANAPERLTPAERARKTGEQP